MTGLRSRNFFREKMDAIRESFSYTVHDSKCFLTARDQVSLDG